ncbi:hypothetical protein D018_4148B, partial [Vibrio parahaemolyticus VP2007-007]
TGA